MESGQGQSPVVLKSGERYCPGNCGTIVRRGTFACRADWFRLPAELRRRINQAWSNFATDPWGYFEVASEGRRWLAADHPRTAVMVERERYFRKPHHLLGRRSVFDRERPPAQQLVAVALSVEDAELICEALNESEEVRLHGTRD